MARKVRKRKAAPKRKASKPAAKPAYRGIPHRDHVRSPRTGIDENFENFIEEIAEHGRRVQRRKVCTGDWWSGTFGAAGPLFAAAIGMAGVAVIAWIISLVAAVSSAPFLTLLSSFLYTNLPVFLLIFLVVNYLKHIYANRRVLYYVLKPVKVAFEVTVAFWIFGAVLIFASMQAGAAGLYTLGASISSALASIFFVFLLLGYIVAIIRRSREDYAS
jgi:hypothetical protein